MNLSKNKTVIVIIAIIVAVIFLYLCYLYMQKQQPRRENFQELKTLNIETMNEAVSQPSMNKWTFQPSKQWYAIKQNGPKMQLKELGFSQYANMSISFFIKINNGASFWRNIFHFSQDGNNCCAIGQRIPAMWVYPNNTTSMHIRFSTDRDGNDGADSGANLVLGRAYLLTLVFDGNKFSYYINKTKVHNNLSFQNIRKRNRDTTMWIGDPWHGSNGGILINNFTVYDGVLTDNDVNAIVDKAEEDFVPPATAECRK